MNPDQFSDILKDKIKSEAFSGVKWTTAKNVFILVGGLVNLYFLARYVPKEAFGIYAIAQVLFMFGMYLSDCGVSEAIMHYRDTSKRQLSSLYWLNIWIGLALFAVFFLLKDRTASYFESPELSNVMLWCGLNILILSLGQQFKVLLQRELRFDILAKIEIAAFALFVCVSIYLAIQGFEVYAIVYAEVTRSVVLALLFVFVGRKIHFPRFIFKPLEIVQHIKFGLYQVGRSGVEYAYNNIDRVLIGRLLDSSILGSFDVAKKVSSKPGAVTAPIISEVSFPLLAKYQDQKETRAKLYLSGVKHMHYASAPFFFFIVLFAQDVIPLVLGPGWNETIEPARFLALYFLVKNFEMPTGSLLMAVGKVKVSFYWNSLMLVVIFLTIALSYTHGLAGIAKALCLIQAVSSLLYLLLVIRPIIQLTLSDLIESFIWPVLMALICNGVTFFCFESLSLSWTKLILCGVTMLALYILLVRSFRPSVIVEFLRLAGRNPDKRS